MAIQLAAESSLSPWRRAAQLARRYLPQGGTLSEERWWKRHKGVLGLLWVHAVIVPIYALIREVPLEHTVAESLVIPITAVIASARSLPRRARTLAAAIGLLMSSGILVHLSGGLIELHFHFFVMVVIISLYQDWIPFLAAIGYVLVHHGVVGALDPGSVYNHPAAINNPWKWAAIHAFFIAGISAASLVSWRLNETIFLHQRRAEERLREEARIVETLNDVGKTLVENLELSEVVQRVVDAGTKRTSAEFGALFYNVVDESGESYLLYAVSGAPLEAFSKFPSPRNTGIFAPTFAGEGVVRLDDVTADPRYGKNPPYKGMPEGHLPVRSYLAVPVTSRGEVLGGLFFGHHEVGMFTETDERIVVGVAAYAAVALDNAKLFEAERRVRAQEEQSRRRLAIVADASRLLGASLNLDAILRNLAELVVPSIADNCVIDFVEDDGSIRRAHLAIEPKAAEANARLPGGPPSPDNDAHPAVRAIRTGESILLEDITPEAIERAVANNEYHAVVAELEPRSAAVVPIIGRDRPLGALTLATTARSGRRLTQDDLALLEELARRTATAIENARSYQMQREAAHTLQQSLLPAQLPQFPALELAAKYVAGKEGTEVGGDWFDVVPVPNGTVGLVIGDVVGRGIEAASLMGQIRNALRAYAFDSPDPGTVLEHLNGLFSSWGATGHFATILYGVFDVETGEFIVASAGHLPPVICKPDGSSQVLTEVRGVPLGAVRTARYQSHRIRLEAGDTLLLYTDGLIEDRRVSIDDGLAKLRSSFDRAADDLGTFVSDVLTKSTEGRDAEDDVAVLAMRFVPLPDEVHLSLPADPMMLKPLRAALRRWLSEAGATPDEVYQLLVATNEACANVIRHARGARQPTFWLDAAHRDGSIRITVRDKGRWREADDRRPGGRGLRLIEQFVDDVHITKGPPQTIVEMERTLACSIPAP